MINLLIILVFLLTVAITSASTLISSHLRTTYKTNFFSSLLFYQVFYFTFGYYAIWGQIIINYVLAPYVSEQNLSRIVDFTILLGTPFLVFASMMYLRFSREISGRRLSNYFTLCYLLLNVILVFVIGYIIVYRVPANSFLVLKYYFILFSLIFVIIGVYNLLTANKKNSKLELRDLKHISTGLLLLILLQNTLLYLYEKNIYLALVFIFIYFILGAFLPLYIKYLSNLSVLLPHNESTRSFEMFCEKFSISRRETEIINEICNGLSNREIADKLFISLQTVKDHTHRIYGKTECAGRSQLIRLVNESLGGK
jgi:DNA-binding CsgD family transcriptional regulator